MSDSNLDKIIIMDYKSGNLYILDYDYNIHNDPCDFFEQEEMSQLSMDSCEYMTVSSEEFSIKFQP